MHSSVIAEIVTANARSYLLPSRAAIGALRETSHGLTLNRVILERSIKSPRIVGINCQRLHQAHTIRKSARPKFRPGRAPIRAPKALIGVKSRRGQRINPEFG